MNGKDPTPANVLAIVNDILKLNMIEVNLLGKELGKRFGIDTDMMSMGGGFGGGGGGGGGAAPAAAAAGKYVCTCSSDRRGLFGLTVPFFLISSIPCAQPLLLPQS